MYVTFWPLPLINPSFSNRNSIANEKAISMLTEHRNEPSFFSPLCNAEPQTQPSLFSPGPKVYFGRLLCTSHWLNLQHWTGFYIAVYMAIFRGSFLFSRALFCISVAKLPRAPVYLSSLFLSCVQSVIQISQLQPNLLSCEIIHSTLSAPSFFPKL